MSSKVRDLTKPTFYLDHSTLMDAFRANAVGGRMKPSLPAYRPLLGWVERVAREANLCLSVFHLDELAHWGDESGADGMAAWYDQLPIVWVRHDLENVEDEHWVKVAAGALPARPVDAFAPSLLSAFGHLTQRAVTALLRSKQPVVTLVRASRTRGEGKEAETFIPAAQLFRENRAWAQAEGWSEAQREEDTASKRRVDLRKRALNADLRLIARADPEYATKSCTAGEVQDLLVSLFESDPRAMPSYKARIHFNQGFIGAAMRRRAPSRKERKDFHGTFHDLFHVSAGAAYCDVSTCDGPVSGWLGGLREELGLRHQLSVREVGPEAFVRTLMSTWP